MRRANFILALTAAVLAAVGISAAQQDRGYYNAQNPGEIRQEAPLRLRDGASYTTGRFPLYPPQLEPGEGREAVEANCSTCHSVRYITMQPPLPATAWEAEVNKMINVFGCDIPPDAKPVVINYLQTHYTPETRKR
jgi:hypothetical protein